jgi:putative ABC transport system permease protein
VQQNLRQALGGEFEVMVNYSDDNPYFKTQQSGESSIIYYSEMPISQKEIDAIMGVPGISHYDTAMQELLETGNMRFIPGNIPIEEEFRTLTNVFIVPGSENDSHFRTGDIELVEGHHIGPNDSGVALVSEEVAEANGLRIGDNISLTGDAPADVEIVGIFRVNKQDSVTEKLTQYDKLVNKIFIDLASFQKMIPSRTVGFDSATFTVADPAQLESIVASVEDISSIDWQAFALETNNEAYTEAAMPLEKLDSLIITMLIIVAGVSALILSLILTMWAKSRVHETGIYLSVGIGKTSIIGQYLAEVLVIAVLAFGLSFFTSGLVADEIGSSLLQQNIQSSEVNVTVEDNGEMVGATLQSPEPSENGGSIMEETTHIDVAISTQNLIQLYLLGFAVVIVSVGVSGVTVMRLKPREILSKMS